MILKHADNEVAYAKKNLDSQKALVNLLFCHIALTMKSSLAQVDIG